ncbi:MAG: ATP-binding cassette domain-containing protein, partial [Nitrospinota bacterium]
MAPLLEVQDLVVGYAADIDILQSVSLRVSPLAITGLIGLNGAGKSTLMKAIYGFLKPKRGRVLLAGEEITGIAPHHLLRKGVWYIPQESSLFPFLSVEDNLRLVASRLDRGQGEERLEEVFQRFPDLQEKRRERAGNLSGGQQKMLEVAKALLVRPRLLLVDE